MKQPTLAQFKRWAKQHQPLAHAVVMAQAFAQCERERVDAYLGPLFSEYGFKNKRTGELIKTYHDLYMCDDEELCTDFYKAADFEHRRHGFTGPDGHCPALIADHLKIKAEAALIEAGCKLMEIENNIYGDLRTKLLKTLLGACLLKEAA